MIVLSVFIIGISLCSAGKLPQIPSNNQAQFFVITNDGGYKYGYDTGSGSFAKQTGSGDNQVEGRYAYNVDGKLIDVSYTAGVQGYVPNTQDHGSQAKMFSPNWNGVNMNKAAAVSDFANDDGPSDGSYSFSYNTGDSERQESSDASGNIMGRYAYTNDAGQHDLTYEAGAEKGFVVTGGSLSLPNGLSGKGTTWAVKSSSSTKPSGTWTGKVPPAWSPKSGNDDATVNSDGSYAFSYNTGDSSRHESADANGNVMGRYSFSNDAGQHDLSYEAGAEKGFLVTGGSLSLPNGLSGKESSWAAKTSPASSKTSWSAETSSSSWSPKSVNDDATVNPDGSYAFSYNTGDSSRHESADANGNVMGRYSFTNDAGQHDLSYEAGAEKGFLVTGGSLSLPNGLSGKTSSWAAKTGPASSKASWSAETPSSSGLLKSASDDATVNSDGSYAFSYNTGDSSRHESADANGNVMGRYSFTNEAGQHDLSYEAGAEKGFVVTGGNLAQPGSASLKAQSPQSWTAKSTWTAPDVSVAKNDESGSAAHSFSYSTNQQTHHETGDDSGRVQGKYSYVDETGHHDLTYTAGGDDGFVVTGGNLAKPTSVADNLAATTKSGNEPKWHSTAAQVESGSLGDAAYSFEYNDGNSARKEASDSAGNIKGTYSYTNDAGQHDLSYEAGADKGFVVIGGSLSKSNEISDTGSNSAWKSSSHSSAPNVRLSNPNDGTYEFSYSTSDSGRQESSDAAGNLQGRYHYTNEAGTHDLSYEAGAEKGFVVTGGSLSEPNGLAGKTITHSATKSHWSSNGPAKSGQYLPPHQVEINIPSAAGIQTKTANFRAGNLLVRNYLPVEGNVKTGYVIEA